MSSQERLGDVVEELRDEVGAHDRRIGENAGNIAKLVKRVDDVVAENKQLRERVADLEAQVDPNPESLEYEKMDRDTKVQKVRLALVRRAATRQNGKASMEYSNVQDVFDGHPSPGHAYDLMELAGQMDGFGYDTNAGECNRIRVDLDAVNDEAMIHAANNAQSSGGS